VAREVAARRLLEYSKANAHCHNALFEIDAEGHEHRRPPAIATALGASDGCGASLTGVMTHAGISCSLSTRYQLAALVKKELSGCARRESAALGRIPGQHGQRRLHAERAERRFAQGRDRTSVGPRR